MEQLIKIMESIRPDLDFTKETRLVDDDILDSFDILSIVNEVSLAYGVEINANHLLPANFNSAEALYSLIQKLLNE